MRLIDADELTEAVWRERLDTRERIADLVARQPTVKGVTAMSKYVELKNGMKKFRSGNFVVYDIDYLLENLAREISMLYQAKRDFNNPIQKTIDKNK